jgi:hypothetical protein
MDAALDGVRSPSQGIHYIVPPSPELLLVGAHHDGLFLLRPLNVERSTETTRPHFRILSI